MTQTHFPAQTCHSPPCRRPPTAAPTPPRRRPSSAFKVVLCCTLDAILTSRQIVTQENTKIIWLKNQLRPRHFLLFLLEGSHHLHPALPLVPLGGGHLQGLLETQTTTTKTTQKAKTQTTTTTTQSAKNKRFFARLRNVNNTGSVLQHLLPPHVW